MSPAARGLIRVLGAGLFVLVAVFAVVAVLAARRPEFPFWPAIALISGAGAAAFAVAMWLFHPKGSDPFHRKSREQYLADLEALGLLDARSYRVTRAFTADPHDDEGPLYFMEVEDGGILYLGGQYLWDYEPMADDELGEQPRRIPCTELTVRWHRRDESVVDLVCSGRVFEPEHVGSFDRASGFELPQDGDVITAESYDRLLARFTDSSA